MDDIDAQDRTLAVVAQSLYLANLTLLPGVAFAFLAVLWFRHAGSSGVLGRNHLRQTFWVSLYGGMLIVLVTAAVIVLLGQIHGSTAAWVAAILYFTCIHSTLLLLGVAGLARALAGQNFRYPVIGPRLVP
ncbi:MAG: hypothetical protein NTZ79_03830 [Proteobacteria bacterium]|nr:hypothetical protein [Pseudomonadota bacterium]